MEGGRCGTAEARKPGFRSTEVLVQHRLAFYCTYVHVPLTVRPVIFFGVCKTVTETCGKRTSSSLSEAWYSGHFARFLVCVRKFMPTEAFLFTYVCMWHTPRTSCTTSEVRPYARTEQSCTGPWSNMVSPMNQRRLHVTCILMSFRSHTRNWARSTDKHVFLVSSRRKWESCFRHPDTHYGLGPACNMNVWALGADSMLYKHIASCNSWFSRSPSLEQTLFPCLHTHVVLGLN